MDVFVIPIGPDRYELYCEAPVEAPQPDAGLERNHRTHPLPLCGDAPSGRGASPQRCRARHARGHAAWTRCRSGSWPGSPSASPSSGCCGTSGARRRSSAFHPQDLTFEQAHDPDPADAAARLRTPPRVARRRQRCCSSDRSRSSCVPGPEHHRLLLRVPRRWGTGCRCAARCRDCAASRGPGGRVSR